MSRAGVTEIARALVEAEDELAFEREDHAKTTEALEIVSNTSAHEIAHLREDLEKTRKELKIAVQMGANLQYKLEQLEGDNETTQEDAEKHDGEGGGIDGPIGDNRFDPGPNGYPGSVDRADLRPLHREIETGG